VLALPHPSPRNNGWLQRHPWFEAEWLPQVRARVAAVLAEDSSQIGL
jgi:uracil-DNA glycosylase